MLVSVHTGCLLLEIQKEQEAICYVRFELNECDVWMTHVF